MKRYSKPQGSWWLLSIRVGIAPVCSFMVPFPEDTEATVWETAEFMKELQELGSKVLLSYTCPYPGTHFYEHAEELGLKILSSNWDEFDAKHVVMETKHLSAPEIESLVRDIVDSAGMHWSVEQT